MLLTRRRFLRGAFGASFLLVGCGGGGDTANEQDGQLQCSFFCFDTTCAIGGTMGQSTLDAAVSRCQDFEALLSRTLDTSDVGRINAAEGAPVEVAEETADLIGRALMYCRSSDGLFDITIGAVTSLWDFHEGIVPTEEQIATALPHVGYACVQVDGTTVTLTDPDARLDLGGIAKGYVADAVLDQIEAAGVQSAYVNLGGNVKVLGKKPDGTPWRVGIRDPFSSEGDNGSVARVSLEGGSVVTSGLYERQFESGGRTYWHILDPRTGYPVESDLVSATIVSERSIDGDGFTKPLFMLGLDGAKVFLEERGLDGLFVDTSGDIHMTSGASFELL